MWDKFYEHRHVWYSFIVVAMLVFYFFVRRWYLNDMQKFASQRGFQFQKKIDPAELRLYETSFFEPWDAATHVLTGQIGAVNFVHFLHHRASGRGREASSHAIAAFEVGSTYQDNALMPCCDGFSMEISNGRLFMWRADDAPSDDGIESFLRSAYDAYHHALK